MAILLAAAESVEPFPGPGPWGARAWLGAALYVAVFLAALWGTWLLVRSDGASGENGEEPRP